MNILQTIEKLASEAIAESERKDMLIITAENRLTSLTGEHEKLLSDYDATFDACKNAEESHQLCRSINKSLLKEIGEKELVIESIENVNELLSGRDELMQSEIDRLKKVERENQVLRNDLKKSVDQVKRLKAVKPQKVTKSYRQLQVKYDEAKSNLILLAKHLEQSPQAEGVFNHLTQGQIDLYRLNGVMMTVDRNGSGAEDVMIERMFAVNGYNSCKVITRINGKDDLGRVTIPKGGVINIDDELLAVSLDRFKINDKNKASLAESLKA